MERKEPALISLLARLFIKPDPAREEPETRRAYGVLCGIVGICLNVLLFAGKFLAGTLSGSIAITADAFNNLSDAGSSFVTLVGFQLAGQKPDSEHPFGHGRMEYVSGLAVSVLILLMGLELGKTSIEKILHPEPVDSSPLIFAILCASILVKLYMFLYNRRLGKKLASPAMEATAMDSLSDSVATAAVLIATLVGRFTGLEIDGWCGVLVAAFILWSGINAVRDTLDPLLGTPPTHEFVQRIRDLVMAHTTILGIHDLIVHDYGPGRVMISLHAEVPANEDVLALHDEIDNVEKELREKLGCDAVIHMDPVVTDDGVTEETRRRVQTLIHCIDDAIDIHDFRMVAGPTHTNLIFDAVVPFGFRLTDQEVEQKIRSAVRALDGNYYAPAALLRRSGWIRAEFHIGVNALHAAVWEMLVKKHIHGGDGGLSADPLGPAVHCQQAHGAVEDHENGEDPGEDLAEPVGDLQNHLSDPGIEAFDPQDAQNAPEQRVEQADPAVEVEGHPTVIPGSGAEESLLPPGEQVLNDTAHHGSAEKGDGGAAVAIAVQGQGHHHCADTVDRVEGTVNQAGAAFDIPVAEEAPQDLHHHARKAAGDADQSDLVKVDAGGKAIRLLLLQVDNGVGGGTAEEALALGALLPLPQAGGELVGLVGGPLMGLTQAGGGILQHLHLPGHVAAQGGLLLRREALLVGQLFVILLILNFQRLFRTQDVLTAIQ